MLEEIRKLLRNGSIEDILLVGFIDVENDEAQFYPDLRFIYLKVGSIYMEFESIEQFSKLSIRIVEEIPYNFEIDEDMIKAKSAIGEIILNDIMASDNEIKRIELYNLMEQEELICDAMEIQLVNEQIIFFDPSYYFGINIGGTDQKKIWKTNFKGNISTKILK